jgi:hypothetical protein
VDEKEECGSKEGRQGPRKLKCGRGEEILGNKEEKR